MQTSWSSYVFQDMISTTRPCLTCLPWRSRPLDSEWLRRRLNHSQAPRWLQRSPPRLPGLSSNYLHRRRHRALAPSMPLELPRERPRSESLRAHPRSSSPRLRQPPPPATLHLCSPRAWRPRVWRLIVRLAVGTAAISTSSTLLISAGKAAIAIPTSRQVCLVSRRTRPRVCWRASRRSLGSSPPLRRPQRPASRLVRARRCIIINNNSSSYSSNNCSSNSSNSWCPLSLVLRPSTQRAAIPCASPATWTSPPYTRRTRLRSRKAWVPEHMVTTLNKSYIYMLESFLI